MVGLGFALDASPSSALSLTLVAVGIWTLISAAFGLCGSFRAECCLKTYLILSSAALTLQVMLCLFLLGNEDTLVVQATGLLFVFISLDSMIDHMASNSKEKEKAIDVLEKTKWPFLIILLRKCVMRARSYEMAFLCSRVLWIFSRRASAVLLRFRDRL